MVLHLGVLVCGPAHQTHFQEAHAAAVGHVVFVAFVLQRDESDAERVQRAFVHQCHRIAPKLGVSDSCGDVKPVVAVLCRSDRADQFGVLVAELGRVGVLENGVTVERFRPVPRVVVDVTERDGHALDAAPVTI